MSSAHSASRAASPPVKLIANQDYSPTLQGLLDQVPAPQPIQLIQYNLFADRPGLARNIVEKLVAMKKATPERPIGLFIEADHGDAKTRNLWAIDALRAAQIAVTPDSENLVTHAKAVRAGRFILAGSTNMTNTSMGSNNEVNLLIESEKLANAYGKYFDALVKHPDRLHASRVTDGKVTMLTDTAYESELMQLIRSTASVPGKRPATLEGSMYDFNFGAASRGRAIDPKAQAVMDALLEAANNRGVKVKLFLEQSDDPQLAPKITAANARARRYLLANDKHGNITVVMDPPKQISHQKFIIANGKEVLLGSTNWTADDFERRHQVNWHVRDAAFARQLQARLEQQMANEDSPPVGGDAVPDAFVRAPKKKRKSLPPGPSVRAKPARGKRTRRIF